MPRYRYYCESCKIEKTIFHGITETMQKCLTCGAENCMTKLVTRPAYIKKMLPDKDQKVGDITQQYIEENREILDQMKTKAKEKTNESP